MTNKEQHAEIEALRGQQNAIVRRGEAENRGLNEAEHADIFEIDRRIEDLQR